jgi:hypothetical protein
MTLESITTTAVAEILSAWRHGGKVPDALLELAALQQAVSRPEERPQALREFVVSLLEKQLQQQRLLAGISPKARLTSKKAAKTAVIADFQSNQKELQGWSALFFRYLSPVNLTVAELAAAIPLSTRQFSRHVKQGLAQLTRLIQQAEQRAQQRSRLRRFLPVPEFSQLFGVDEVVLKVVAQLTAADGPRFISIEGLGGVGKTAVAQAIAYHFAEQTIWQDILWISARQEWITAQGQLEKIEDPVYSLEDVISRFAHQLGQEQLAGLTAQDKLTRLEPLLSSQPHLIIIDNLETLTDTQALLPALFPLAGQTRFLLTSRHSLRDTGYVYTLPLPELASTASQALIESELERQGQAVTLSESVMTAIYQTIGGLPLALKLVTAQLGTLPLEYILNGLHNARRQSAEEMYKFIYQRTWRLLSPEAHHLLLTMLLVSPEGEAITWMKLMSNMPPENFDEALLQLRRYSLLETAGGLEEPRYRLHRLTTTFLQTEVLLQW